MTWPPKGYEPAFNAFEHWSALWSGDQSALMKSSAFNVKPSQYAGGIVGAAARLWWGKPRPQGSRARLHSSLAADIAQMHANLVFGTPPTIEYPDETIAQRLDELINGDMAREALLIAAEYQPVFGGCFVRAVHFEGETLLVAQSPDMVVPQFMLGKLVSATFYTIVDTTNTAVFRYAETHSKGQIKHELYQGTSSDVGKPVPLNTLEVTKALGAADGELEHVISTGTERLTAMYVPNKLPQKLWRKIPELTYYGVSSYSSIEATLDKIDEVYDAWMQDIDHAKSRLIVPSTYLETYGPGGGAGFDMDREIFTSVEMIGNADAGMQIHAQQFNIRWMEHLETIKQLMREAIGGAGLSASTMGMEEAGAATATEVKDRSGKTDVTVKGKQRMWRSRLVNFAQAVVEFDAAMTGKALKLIEPVSVNFTEDDTPDMEALARTVQALRTAQAMSIETAVKMVHPDWDSDDIAAEVARIMDETSVSVPELFPEYQATAEEPPTEEPAEPVEEQ